MQKRIPKPVRRSALRRYLGHKYYAYRRYVLYPHGDLMVRNDTDNTYQIRVAVGDEFLRGSIRCDVPPSRRYEIVEKNHRIENTWWGGYSRHNELCQQMYDSGGALSERLIVENDAILMYSPLLEGSD